MNRYALFCPTVGPILSAAIPGIGLYSVLIFSSIVYNQCRADIRLKLKQLTDTEAYGLSSLVKEQRFEVNIRSLTF